MAKTIKIAFAHGGTLPASVMGTKKDVPVSPHEPAAVPEGYGRQLIEDRFAYLVDEKADKARRDAVAAQQKSAAIASAEQAVALAQKKVADAAGDDDATAIAEAALQAAQDDLDKANA